MTGAWWLSLISSLTWLVHSCSGYNYLKELAVVYQQMKQIDPYHLTAGALECGEMHAFQEPHLSLDAPMRENYRQTLGMTRALDEMRCWQA